MIKRWGIILAIGVFLLQLLLLPHAGMTWDEPASFFIGRSNLKFWMTGDRAYLNDIKNPDLFKDSPFFYTYGEEVYPPFPFTISSAFSYVLAEHLHVMKFVDAHHLGEVVIGSLGVWAFFGIAILAGLSVSGAIGTTLLYALYPTIFAQMRSDAKDVPLMSLLVIAVYFCLKAIDGLYHGKKPKSWVGYIIACGIFFGLAEATKPTAVVLAPILLIWFISSITMYKQIRTHLRQMLIPFFCLQIIAAGVALASFFLAWPWLWEDPIGRLGQVWAFFKIVGLQMPTPYLGKMYSAGINVPREYPFAILFLQTPLIITLFAILGTLSATWQFLRRKNYLAGLFVLWFFLGMARFFAPHVLIYAKVRHFIDVMPAFLMLAGMGITCLASGIHNIIKNFPQEYIVRLVFIICIGVEIWIAVTMFPYEPSYFNGFVGGTKTVAEKGLFDVEYWASGVKEAVEAINRVALPGEKIYACQMQHVAIYYNRPDIRVTSDPAIASYAIVPNSPSWFGGALGFYKANHQLIYTVKRAGGDLFYVYRYTSPFGWNCGSETETTYRE